MAFQPDSEHNWPYTAINWFLYSWSMVRPWSPARGPCPAGPWIRRCLESISGAWAVLATMFHKLSRLARGRPAEENYVLGGDSGPPVLKIRASSGVRTRVKYDEKRKICRIVMCKSKFDLMIVVRRNLASYVNRQFLQLCTMCAQLPGFDRSTIFRSCRQSLNRPDLT